MQPLTPVRRATAAAAVTGLALLGLSLGTGAASAATVAPAAPQALTPAYPGGASAPSMVPYGAVGYGLTTLNGESVDLTTSNPFYLSLPADRASTGQAEFLAPPSSSGQRIDRRFTGTFSYSVSNSTGGRSGYELSSTGKLLLSPDQTPPVGTQFSDGWMWVGDTGTRTYTFDFSGLKDGVLPAGAVLSANDVDACESDFTVPETETFASDATGDWMKYWTNVGSGTPSIVSQDGSTYSVVPNPPCVSGANQVTETFKTTVPLHTLTVTLQNVVPERSGVGLSWELLAPTEPIAALTTSATNKADGTKQVPADGTVSDVVNYTGLVPGTEYTISGKLMDKATGKATGLTASKTFTPTAADGSVEVDYPVGSGVAGDTLVAFETVSDSAGAVASHEDLGSAAQTITVAAVQPPVPPHTGGGGNHPASHVEPAVLGPSVNTGGTVHADAAGDLARASGPAAAAAGVILLLGMAAVWMRQKATTRGQRTD